MTWTFVQKGRLPAEIVHFYESAKGDRITSLGNRLDVRCRGESHRIALPLSAKERLFSKLRLTRRALRLDKSNAVFNRARDGVVVIYRGNVFFFDLTAGALTKTAELRQCRNVLHGGIAVTPHGIYFGEYGSNPVRDAVPVWRSTDDGRSWQVVYEFPAKSIRHVHGVYHDPFTDRLWLPTGDRAGECYVASANADFSDVVTHGDGTQVWRPVSMFFEADRIVWPMDSELQTSHLQVFDRASGRLTEHRAFPGPVWYGKRFTDGLAILQTTVEIGAGVQSDCSHLFVSENLTDWHEVAKFKKDLWPVRHFKAGVIAFADGSQASDDFVLFGEALAGLDGKSLQVALKR